MMNNMFIAEKKNKKFGAIDVVVEQVAESILTGSMKPIKMLFRKGRYGTHGCLKGSYIDYRVYLNRIEERRRNVAVTTIR